MPPIRTPTNNTFCFQGRRALLTYSRVGNFFVANDLTVALVPHIARIATDEFRWKWAIEKHDDDDTFDNDMEDGSWHVHFTFDLGKCCTERGQIFDYQGIHPNIKPCGGKVQRKNTLNYLEKDGWFKTNIDDEMDETINGAKGENIFSLALSKDTEVEFLSTLSNGVPKDFCKSYLSIKACGKDRYTAELKKWTARRTLADFNNVPRVLRTMPSISLAMMKSSAQGLSL